MNATALSTIPIGTTGSALPHASAKVETGKPSLGRRLIGYLQGAVELLVVVWSIPFIMLLVSAPLVLAIALLVRLVNWAVGA